MNIPNIKDCVGPDKRVTFARFQDDSLWYVCENGFEFPITVTEAKGGTFLSDDRSGFFMRWINSHIKFLRNAEAEAIVNGL